MMIEKGMLKTLADIGFMASSAGMSKHAFAIFAGIEKVQPDSVLPDIGYALEFMNKKKYQEAIGILTRQALPKDPDNATAQAFIGLALMLDGHNKEAEACLDKIKNTEDSATAIMAQELLNEVRGVSD